MSSAPSFPSDRPLPPAPQARLRQPPAAKPSRAAAAKEKFNGANAIPAPNGREIRADMEPASDYPAGCGRLFPHSDVVDGLWRDMIDTNSSTPSGCEFSLEGYGAVVQAGLASGYRFLTFSDLRAARDGEGRQCLLRHDVDVSPDFALRMARVEHRAGVRSTYFVMLRSPAYNLMSRHSALAVREIVALGHDIGVHFDAAHPLAAADLPQQVLREADIVGELAGREVASVSFHQPSAAILTQDIVIPGLINAYSKSQLAGWHYLSDSNRRWKSADALEALRKAEHPRIQLLTHPVWWACDGATTHDVWDQAIAANFEIMQHQFLDTEVAYGPPRRLSLAKARSGLAAREAVPRVRGARAEGQ